LRRESAKSPIGLYYYTFRDFNSLCKNASFLNKEHPNGIVVTVENFFQYAYLYTLKKLFKPEDAWIYGNLSPLVIRDELIRKKKLFVKYAILANPIFRDIENGIIEKISIYYKLDLKKEDNPDQIEEELRKTYFPLLIPTSIKSR
jgi:hypothetical protein